MLSEIEARVCIKRVSSLPCSDAVYIATAAVVYLSITINEKSSAPGKVERNGKNFGVEQSLSVEEGLVPNRVYFTSAYIKFVNPIDAYHQIEIYVTKTSGGKNSRTVYGKTAFLRPCDEWVRVGGDFKTDADTTKVAVAFVVGKTDKMDYFMDTGVLVQADYEDDWRASANQRIDKLRKGPVTFKLDNYELIIWLTIS
ncbi:hypothetical protein CAPTEDRAFT_191328 [Capitella teleta]|uniref:CBM-cenC domain-containing protein n=1 Tax=Capitella teleta TaxID=283909 RepID=R7U6C2_CAPTE|nr:hypothetical protein CAPTEDRAFT_191328 [Capitella teleta]|eukprot:ELU01900.1 hypothetical protein CAPTEDRAFT_191328 [Capitella teleta]